MSLPFLSVKKTKIRSDKRDDKENTSKRKKSKFTKSTLKKGETVKTIAKQFPVQEAAISTGKRGKKNNLASESETDVSDDDLTIHDDSDIEDGLMRMTV